MTDTSSPPFEKGQRVVFVAHPESGSLIIGSCEATPSGWWITAMMHPIEGLSPVFHLGSADLFVRCPAGWVEPPLIGCTATHALECSTDGEIEPWAYARARQEDREAATDAAERALAWAEWWSNVGRLIVGNERAEAEMLGWARRAAEVVDGGAS